MTKWIQKQTQKQDLHLLIPVTSFREYSLVLLNNEYSLQTCSCAHLLRKKYCLSISKDGQGQFCCLKRLMILRTLSQHPSVVFYLQLVLLHSIAVQTADLIEAMQYIVLRGDSEKMAMLVKEITRRQSKFWIKMTEYVAFATAVAMVAFTAWQIWVQYFVTPGGGKYYEKVLCS